MSNIPKGFKLVPVEPTEEMQVAGGRDQDFCSTCGYDNGGGYPANTYTDMLAAAPAPPQPIYDEAAELERFSTQWKLEGRIYRDKNTHQWLPTRDTIEGFQMAETVRALWMGWQSCAQSRAKAGEDE